MKKIFRKNQLVITALALMIAVAGYFSYMNNNMDDGKLQTAAEAANAEVSAGELEEDYDISDEDVLQNESLTMTDTASIFWIPRDIRISRRILTVPLWLRILQSW